MENDFRKMAEKVSDDHYCCRREVGVSLTMAVEDVLRTTAEKHEKIGWNKAVEECSRLVPALSLYNEKLKANAINCLRKEV